MKARFRAILIVTLLAMPLYSGNYLYLSEQGEFVRVFTETNIRGGSEVKLVWGPKLLAHGYQWNYFLLAIYMPLYFLDQAFWHRNDEAFNGEYPVNKDVIHHMEQLGN